MDRERGRGNPLRSRVRHPSGCHRHGSVLPQQLARHPKKQQHAEIWPKYSVRLTISFDCNSLLQRAICVCVCVFGWPLTDSMNYRQTRHFILTDNTQIYSTVLSKHFFPTLGYTWSAVSCCFQRRGDFLLCHKNYADRGWMGRRREVDDLSINTNRRERDRIEDTAGDNTDPRWRVWLSVFLFLWGPGTCSAWIVVVDMD